MEHKDARFSDTELIQLRKNFDEHKKQQDERWEQMCAMHLQNTKAITELSRDLRFLAANTAGVVKLYKDVKATGRVSDSFQKFLLWLGKWGIIGAGAVKLIEWLMHLSKG